MATILTILVPEAAAEGEQVVITVRATSLDARYLSVGAGVNGEVVLVTPSYQGCEENGSVDFELAFAMPGTPATVSLVLSAWDGVNWVPQGWKSALVVLRRPVASLVEL